MNVHVHMVILVTWKHVDVTIKYAMTLESHLRTIA